MRAVLLVALTTAALMSPPSLHAADIFAPPEGTIVLVPLQMSDGSKLWRFATKAITHDHAEESLRDLIAQGMGKALWCPNGWEEIRRTEPSKGLWLIEGRCK